MLGKSGKSGVIVLEYVWERLGKFAGRNVGKKTDVAEKSQQILVVNTRICRIS
jgi:hypothetical protein